MQALDQAHSRPVLSGVLVRSADFVVGSVPVVTGRTLAVCRVLFGGLLLYFVSIMSPNSFTSFAASGSKYHFATIIDETGIITFLSSNPDARFLFYWSIVGLLVLFIAGAMTRIAYALLVVALWFVAFLTNEGHFYTPLLSAVSATVIAPWGDHWSIDSLLRRGRSEEPVDAATPFYGYAIWLLGLVIGLTYMNAGLSKLVLTNGAWLWETGARNGLIQDMRYAVTDWGMVVSNSYLLSLGASIFSSFGQIIYVYACFTRVPLIKYGIGLFVALPFLAGLMLTMGLFWWPWGVLVLILYLPWPSIDRLAAGGRQRHVSFDGSPRIRRHRHWFLGATGVLIAVHLYAVISKTEYEPLYSNYPMYADTMLAGGAYEAEFWERYRTYDRNYKRAIQVVETNAKSSENVVRDISTRFDHDHFWARYGFYQSDLIQLSPDQILRLAKDDRPIGGVFCETLHRVTASLAQRGSEVSAIRYAKRYFDLVDGRLFWLTVDTWIEVDLTAPGCPYRKVGGASS